MTKYKIHHKNYTEFGETYQLVLPLCLEGLIPDDDASTTLHVCGAIRRMLISSINTAKENSVVKK